MLCEALDAPACVRHCRRPNLSIILYCAQHSALSLYLYTLDCVLQFQLWVCTFPVWTLFAPFSLVVAIFIHEDVVQTLCDEIQKLNGALMQHACARKHITPCRTQIYYNNTTRCKHCHITVSYKLKYATFQMRQSFTNQMLNMSNLTSIKCNANMTSDMKNHHMWTTHNQR